MKQKKSNMLVKNPTGVLSNRLRRGWNWQYAFSEKVMPDGARRTLVVEHQLRHRKYGADVVVSNYPGGHPYEDAFFEDARENGIVWKEVRERTYLTGWLIDASICSEIVKTFAAALAAINRVSVIITPRKEEEK